MQVSCDPNHSKVSGSRRRISEPFISDIPQAIRLDLQGHSFFSTLPESLLERLLRCIHLQRFACGDLLIREGTTGKSLFLVIKGVAEVLSERSDVVMAELHRGSFFGEIGLFYGVKRTATVRARTILTVAILSRKDALEVLKDESTAFKTMVGEAQKRYRLIRPPATAGGHTATPHYMAVQLKSTFPQFEDRHEDYLMELVERSWHRHESKMTIISFMRGSQSTETVLLVLSGRVVFKDEVNNIATVHGPGSAVGFPETSHYLAHIIAQEETSALIVLKRIYLAALEGNPLPKAETVLHDISQCATSTVNLVEETLGGATRRRRNTVDNVFWHNQTAHLAQVPRLEKEGSVGVGKDLEDLPDMAALQALLSLHQIATDDPSRILPMLDARYVDLSTISAKMSDSLMKNIVDRFGGEWKALVLCGFSLTDLSLEYVTTDAHRLTELYIQDCMLFSTEALCRLMSSCPNLHCLHVKNCPGFSEACLQFLGSSGAQLECLELSFLRNLGHGGWSGVSLFASSLRSLTLHRITQLSEANIRSGTEETTFGHLRRLDLSESAFISTNGLRAMLARMPNLRELRLGFCTGLDETVAKAVPADSKLEVLDLSFCSRVVLDRTLAALLPKLPNLTTLIANNVKHPTQDSLKELLKYPGLQQVSLSGCPLISEDQFGEAAHKGGWNRQAQS